MAYWVNPAVLLATTLGFVDVFLAIPAVGAVVAASYGRAWLAGALFAAAVLTKPQGIFVAPVVALALWHAGSGRDARRLAVAIAAAALTASVIAAPVVAAGRTYVMLRSIAVLAGHDMLSGLAFNAWWIVSYLIAAASAGGGLRAALSAPVEVVTHARAAAAGLPHTRVIGILLFAGAAGWAVRTAWRARDLGLHAATAAFVVVAYFTLSVQVHENHFFLALPLLAIAAALRPAFAPVFAALSVAFALNLWLIYGFRGDGPAEWATRIGGVDVTVLLAVVVCAMFAWLAAVLARECAAVSEPVTAAGRA
jgi:hypothetical protein